MVPIWLERRFFLSVLRRINGEWRSFDHSAHDDTMLLRCVFRDGLLEIPSLSMNQKTKGWAARGEGV